MGHLDFGLAASRTMIFLLFLMPPNLWSFVMATLGKYHKDPDYFEPLDERKRMNFLITGIAQE